jgi:hypothetical protein
MNHIVAALLLLSAILQLVGLFFVVRALRSTEKCIKALDEL